MRRIGLLGGTSWESSAHYYAQLNEGVRERLGGFHSADLVLRSVDFAEVEALQVAGDWVALGERYAAEGRALRAAGAELVGILANTMHLVADDVAAGSGLPVVHVVDAVADAAERAGARHVGLLGTAYTMASDLYPSRLAPRGIETLVPDPADADEVHRLIYAELVHGRVTPATRQAYVDVVERLVARGVDAVVLGCTELAMLLPGDTPFSPVPVLDSTAVHVNALLDAALAAGLPVEEEGAA
ncbi:aspartate/glutamate racemase family protein [Cellulomonas carbonis]|uniref:Racemase n=1 Tax=Cellulomonas carbonis T26 TaxID=947969 RepID=A0A0A0BU40_9CELL|nr:amino acid racemase [Cellulomonas carbonis]KGM11192.1 racemase [Cellulomonas carbonis T26]GGC12355.1 aspartate racemase [Cellulomonas carbonis]